MNSPASTYSPEDPAGHAAGDHGPFPIVFHSGFFLPADEARVSIYDRGLLYGDGLFETILVRDGHPLRWELHLDRLDRGAEFLHIARPHSAAELHAAMIELIRRNRISNALLRLTLTRGVGPRGYSFEHASLPTLFMSLHSAPVVDPRLPARWRLVTSKIRISPDDPLTGFKTCNRLAYVLARYDADIAHADDALLLNTRGEVTETSCANVFWLRKNCLCTTPLTSGVLPGITRAGILRLSASLGLTATEVPITLAQLFTADAVFLTVTSRGIVEVTHLDNCPLARSPLVHLLHAAWWNS